MPAEPVLDLPKQVRGTAKPARIIRSDAEGLAVAQELAAKFAAGAAERDRERRLPFAEVEAFSQSGLWAVTVPAAFGGADVSCKTLAKIVEIISAADPSLGQIPQNHYSVVFQIRAFGTAAQQCFFFGEILRGARLGNALAELTRKAAHRFETELITATSGYKLRGRKFYSTGALFADYISVGALDPEGRRVTVLVERGAPGLTIEDDWSGFGQRTTASGTVILDDVPVTGDRVLPFYNVEQQAVPNGALAQLIQAAIDVGIAAGALEDTKELVRSVARPWRDAESENPTEDPYTITEIGRLEVELHAAQAVLQRAGGFVDRAITQQSAEHTAEASALVAAAKILANDAALNISGKLFELAGARATLAPQNYDRHWRNARVHTLHDPVRWKYNVIGNWVLNGKAPPRHGLV
jgi:SfnB family sulfur acquisition oxidoreductase